MYQINCGGPASSGGPDAPFSVDKYGSGGEKYPTTQPVDTRFAPASVPGSIYSTERWGLDFSYKFPGFTPNKTYSVRLHFAEYRYDASGYRGSLYRHFNVTINGSPVLTNFDVFRAAGAVQRAIAIEVMATADSAGKIAIVFSGQPDNTGTRINAICSGIEVNAETYIHFQETAPYTGFDGSGTQADADLPDPRTTFPPWLIVSMPGQGPASNQVDALINSLDAANPVKFESEAPNAAAVSPDTATTSPQRLSVIGINNPQYFVNIFAKIGAMQIATLKDWNKSPQMMSVAFHFIKDTANHQTSRTPGDMGFVQGLIDEANQIWNRQGNVHFTLKSVDSGYYTYQGDLGSPISIQKWNQLMTQSDLPKVSDAWNVYFVWHQGNANLYANTFPDQYSTAFNDDTPSQYNGKTLAHEAGHMLNLIAGNYDQRGHSKDTQNLMYPFLDQNMNYIRKYQLDIVTVPTALR